MNSDSIVQVKEASENLLRMHSKTTDAIRKMVQTVTELGEESEVKQDVVIVDSMCKAVRSMVMTFVDGIS
jgi:hypothetical protein